MRRPNVENSVMYACVASLLKSHLRNRFVNLESTNIRSANRFQNVVKPHSVVASKCLDLLSNVLTYNGASSLLGMRKVHLIDTGSARTLLMKGSNETKHKKLLDIGSGNGDVTDCLSPLFEEVSAIEVSGACRFALKKRHRISRVLKDMNELDSEEQFDVISLLNVLDRCDCPNTLLSSVHERVGKYLLVSAAYPWVPFSIESGDILSKWRSGQARRR